MNVRYLVITSVMTMSSAMAGDIFVNLQAKDIKAGAFECSLWKGEAGFPDTKAKALLVTKGSEENAEMICAFRNVLIGTYAVSASQDLNNNSELDNNFLGIPKEPWGTSNNIRPSFRAPTFTEAKFELTGESLRINLEVVK